MKDADNLDSLLQGFVENQNPIEPGNEDQSAALQLRMFIADKRPALLLLTGKSINSNPLGTGQIEVLVRNCQMVGREHIG